METFQAILVQDIGDETYPYSYAVTDANGNTVEDPLDHGLSNVTRGNRLIVYMAQPGSNDYQETLRAPVADVDFIITDCRVVVRSDDYDKGKKWSGGLSAVALNAIEKSAAKKRMAGTVLMGHIRYEWLYAIGYMRKKKTFLDYEKNWIRIGYEDRNRYKFLVEVGFPMSVDVASLANELLHKVSAYRLSLNKERKEKERQYFTKYMTENIEHNPDPNQVSEIVFPWYYFAPLGKGARPEHEGM